MFKKIAFGVYAVSDMPRARAFYEGVLGLVPGKEFDGSGNPNWVEYDLGPDSLAIGCSPEWKPSEDGATIALETDTFDATIAELKKKGATFKLEPQDFPTCHMAVVTDPDGNKILIHHKK